MSKIIVTLFLVTLYTLEVSAQETNTDKLVKRFELVGGTSLSKNSGYLSDYGSLSGYSFGVGYYQTLSKSFSLNIRSLYETKGSTATYSYGLTDTNGTSELIDKYTTKFNYLTFYLLPTFDLGKNKNIHIGAGGYYSFLQKLSVNTFTTSRLTGDFVSENTTTNENYFDPKYDAGVSFQLGYSFNVNEKNQIMLQAFANRGLVDLYNPSMGSQRNNTFGLTLSFRRR